MEISGQVFYVDHAWEPVGFRECLPPLGTIAAMRPDLPDDFDTVKVCHMHFFVSARSRNTRMWTVEGRWE